MASLICSIVHINTPKMDEYSFLLFEDGNTEPKFATDYKAIILKARLPAIFAGVHGRFGSNIVQMCLQEREVQDLVLAMKRDILTFPMLR